MSSSLQAFSRSDSPGPPENRRVLPWWTWLLPLVLFHLGTRLSLISQIVPGTALWYLPIPLGLILVQWWGYRILPALYANAWLSAPLWGLHEPAFGPLYALPEVLAVALSHWLFRMNRKSDPELPNLRQAIRFATLGLTVPIGVGAACLQILISVTENPQTWPSLMRAISESAIADLFASFALVPLALMAFTPAMTRRGLALPHPGAGHRPVLPAPAQSLEKLIILSVPPLIGSLLPMPYFGFLAGMVALWTIVRTDRLFSLSVNIWLLIATELSHALLGRRDFTAWIGEPFMRVQLTLIITSLSSLIGGNTLHDLRREISLRQSALRALRETQSRFREFAGHIEDAIFLVDRKTGMLAYINPAGEKILGLPPESLEMRSNWLADALAPGQEELAQVLSRPGFWNEERQIDFRLAASPPMLSTEIAQRVSPGQAVPRWARLRVYPNRNSLESAPRAAGILSDITQSKANEAHEAERRRQLRETDKLASLGMLVGGVAHEINNPNALILLAAESLQDRLAASPQGLSQDETGRAALWVQSIVGGSDRITRIVSSLKDFARIDDLPRLEVFSVEKLFEATWIIAGHIVRDKTRHFSQYIEPDLPAIRGNFQKLEQALIHILNNAGQALENPDQAIALTAIRDAEGWVCVQVSDEGRGIAPEDLPRVCEPFFTTRRDKGGSGLGLAVTFGIIQEQGGRLDILSRPGQGTTVRLHIPAHPNS